MEPSTIRRPDRWLSGDPWHARCAGCGIDALLAMFLVLLGWKMTYGLGHVLDIELADETYYLRAGLDYLSRRPMPEWSPLYSFVYWALSRWIPDPIALYMANQELQTILLPVALLIALRALSVGRLPALLLSAYFLISAANLPVWPKPMHFAMSLLLILLGLFFRFRASPARVPLLVLGAGCASLIRPEFLLSFVLLIGVLIYELIARGARVQRALYGIACLAPVVLLFVHFGLPFSEERSFAAFADHFVMNYTHGYGLVGDSDPIKVSILRAKFGDAHTVLGAAAANPSAFLWHVAINFVHLPRALATLVLGHYNLILPRGHFLTTLEAVLLCAIGLGFLWRVRGRIALERAGALSLDLVCLACLAVPVLAAILVVAPRTHYVMALEILILLALCRALRVEHAEAANPIRGLAIMASALLIATPALGSLYWNLDGPIRELAVAPRPVLETIQFLRGLRGTAPLVVCESFTGAIDAYLGPGARSISVVEEHGASVDDLVSKDGVNVFVIDSQFRDPRVLNSVPGLAAFLDDPERLNFHRRVLEDAGVTLLVSDRLHSALAPGGEGG
jgi:hypothetical protein